MKIGDIIDRLKLEVMIGSVEKAAELSGAYSSDLLSDVIANSKKDNIWITLQTHLNIIAVAKLKELSAIIIVLNKQVDSNTIKKANEEGILLLRTDLNAFQVAGKLYEMGLR